MHERYVQSEIAEIWSDAYKLKLWQKTELAVLIAMARLDLIAQEVPTKIAEILEAIPIDLDWWKVRDKEVNHDLNAFLDERRRHLPLDLQPYWHASGMTSYDTEEPAMAEMLRISTDVVVGQIQPLLRVLMVLAKKYRFTFMMAKTHGQEAELQSFGLRFLRYHEQLWDDHDNLIHAAGVATRMSKLSGAIGNYGGLSPEVEKIALELLGLKPFYGATQIMPRELYAPLAQALAQTVGTLDKIGMDIRLGARSGRPIMQEPFGKKQKGSSAMPHKKNTIATEQLEGMSRMALGYLQMIMNNISTWEERAIEQSCVERVAWPDLFHVAVQSLKVANRVLSGLRVYPDNMFKEIVDTRGTYAASHAKELLKGWMVDLLPDADEAYRIVQLAAFNAIEPSQYALDLRDNPPLSMEDAMRHLVAVESGKADVSRINIKDIISSGSLRISSQLAADEATVERLNVALRQVFLISSHLEDWKLVFDLPHLLRHEAFLYEKILDL